MNIVERIALLLLFLLPPATLPLFAQAGGTLTGTIRDGETLEGIPNVNMTLRGTGFGAATDINGRYTIGNIPPGNYTLVVSSVGYKRVVTSMVISAGQTLVRDFNLERETLQVGEIMVYGASLRQERITEFRASGRFRA